MTPREALAEMLAWLNSTPHFAPDEAHLSWRQALEVPADRVEWGIRRGDWAPEPGSVIHGEGIGPQTAREIAQDMTREGRPSERVSREIHYGPWQATP